MSYSKNCPYYFIHVSKLSILFMIFFYDLETIPTRIKDREGDESGGQDLERSVPDNGAS